MELDSGVVLQLGTLAAIIATAVIAWFREGRTRAWAIADAAALAKKLQEENATLAAKVSKDAADVVAEGNMKAAVLAKDLIADALKVADKVTTAAEKLAITVKEGQQLSVDAVQGAKHAFGEANSQNSKIVHLGEKVVGLGDQMAEIMTHVKTLTTQSEANERHVHDEIVFNARIKTAIEEALKAKK